MSTFVIEDWHTCQICYIMILTHSLHQGFITDPNDDEQASPCDTVTRLCDSGAGTMLKFHSLLKIGSTYCVAFPFFFFFCNYLLSIVYICIACCVTCMCSRAHRPTAFE